MSNQKGNQYPLWLITNQYQVFACKSDGTTQSMSNTDFAMEIAVSEDGTVWVLSTEPDPDGGGAKIYWSNGDNNWNEINTPEEGGVQIAGGTGSNCYYLNASSHIYELQTDGTATKIYDQNYVVEMDYGGGYIWALIDESNNGQIGLYYSKAGSSLQFNEFEGNYMPYGLSVDHGGNCFSTLNSDPVYFSNDGKSTGSAGSGANGKTLSMSAKNWNYLVSTEFGPNYNNKIMVWVDTQGGVFQDTNFEGNRIAATYHVKS